jgi:uncharacterized protein (UPF0276 family)
MASADQRSVHSKGLALATTYEGDDIALLERIISLVDIIEISPDTIAQSNQGRASLRKEILEEYKSAGSEVKFVAHGIGLSIGSFDCWEENYLRLLDELFDHVELEWHSEHLACTVVAGENVGTMFAMPRTEEALDLVCDRVRLIQERYAVPFLLEHVVHVLSEPPADYTEAGFLNAIAQRTGCGLLLDAYNLECDAINHGLNIREFFEELDFSPVRELHVAGGVEHKGFQLDIHSNPTRDTTLDVAQEIIRRAPQLRAITFEFLKEAVPLLGHESICRELSRLRQAIQ